ncbi:MAG: glycosyltransferase family 9 protein [Ignavibacteriae bacterium]|nr:glycosyltransferase family 9 protein [Ignavibacteriota bacterium]MCB9216417.1 glycosyltransferase family 9 protein [Ignavibacteria bacterium]
MNKSGSKKKPLPKRIAGAILRTFAARPQGKPKLKPEELQRVLLIRYDRLGDMVITTPLIETLSKLAPQAEIDLLGSWRNIGLIENDPRIHQVLRWDGSPLKRLQTLIDCRRRGYDLTFQLLLWRTTLPGLLAGLLTPKGRVVSRDDANNRMLFEHTYKVNSTTHYAEQVYGFLGAALDLPYGVPPMPDYSLYRSPEVEDRVDAKRVALRLPTGSYIVLNISAGEREREMNRNQLLTLLRGLIPIAQESALKIVITGGPDRKALGEELAEQMGAETVVSFFSSIPEAIPLIAHARLIITPDTGTNHLASAVRTPTVVYFLRNGRPVGWGPRGVPHRIVQATEGNDAGGVSIEEVLSATCSLLDERDSRS